MTQQKQKYTSLKRFQLIKNVDRRFLWQYVGRKLRGKVLVVHVMSVVNILLDELTKELLTVGSIKIGNFGKMFFKQMSPRRHYDFSRKKIMEAKGRAVLRFKLNKKAQLIITNNLDVAKTFVEDDNGKEGT